MKLQNQLPLNVSRQRTKCAVRIVVGSGREQLDRQRGVLWILQRAMSGCQEMQDAIGRALPATTQPFDWAMCKELALQHPAGGHQATCRLLPTLIHLLANPSTLQFQHCRADAQGSLVTTYLWL